MCITLFSCKGPEEVGACRNCALDNIFPVCPKLQELPSLETSKAGWHMDHQHCGGDLWVQCFQLYSYQLLPVSMEACNEKTKYQLARSSHLHNLALELHLNQNISGNLI